MPAFAKTHKLPSEELAPKLEASREAPHAVANSVRHAEEATGMWLPGGLFISERPTIFWVAGG